MARRKNGPGRRTSPGIRPQRAAELVRQEVSRMLIDGSLIKDPRVQNAMITVTEVTMSPDLHYANIYVSVIESESTSREDVVEGLASATGVVRREIGSKIRLKNTPEVRFFLDESLEKGARIQSILDELDVETSEDDG